ncbi:putative membrane protein [Rhodobium orientis]|uniref:TIGR01620 family protein n=1 Tax=Rhodobium orientis TaxID=34017 RepID=A0A327JP64_9HYPH|nr:TIGR01620 family protein [Rhodobium orientis]MBB4301850.1 putative membrane protein [Rhodobium orientis]MBK5948375.1 TIGR01620 family protein [Rhodobium orientis]RAI25208.1 TIGR01620 family protein [Rhodobium orientis]
MTDPSRRPKAFRLDEADVVLSEAPAESAAEHADLAVVVAEEAERDSPYRPKLPKRRWRWSTILVSALGGLISLAVGVAIDRLISDLFARADWLGWLAVALASLVVVAALAMALRELFGLWRLARIDRLRSEAEAAARDDDRPGAEAVLKAVVALYKSRADTARGRAAIAAHEGEIIDGRDLIVLAERDLMRPLDREATRMITNSAKRVSVVTAISPRALIDVLFVFAESLRLIRRVSTLYGGRPGGLGFFRLTRHVIGHLAVTGTIAIGDSMIHELVGQGLAARISARLGEGVVNGLLTARIGIAAVDVCRPIPFIGETRPKIGNVFNELVKAQKKAASPEGGVEAEKR